MAQTERALPDFERPPVSEVAMSVEFAPLDHWSLAKLVTYWRSIEAEFPEIAVQPELPPSIDKFAADAMLSQQQFLRFNVSPDASRFWLVGAEPQNLIQIQRDRFIVNWRKVKGDETYPRYLKHIRPAFLREWSRFKSFLADQGVTSPVVQQCEVTYINDVVRGHGWETVEDISKLLAPWSGNRSEKFLPNLESLNLTCSFLMIPDKGRLYVTVQHLRRTIDNAEVIQIRLFARNKTEGDGIQGLLDSMDQCHDWIVRGFTDLTTPEAQKLWIRNR